MLKILKILRRASQNNCFRYKNSNAYRNYSALENLRTSSEGPLLKSWCPGPTGNLQRTVRVPIQKFMVYDLLLKLYFRSNGFWITYLLLSFIAETNV